MSNRNNKPRVFIIGVGMTKFEKPGKRDWDYPDMAALAIQDALADASVPAEAIEAAVAGFIYADSCAGQRALYGTGIMEGVPVFNVNNNCATGASAVYLAKTLLGGGMDCVLAFGFEKMKRGAIGSTYQDRTNPLDKHMATIIERRGFDPRAPPAAQIFSAAGSELMEKYPSLKPKHFAMVAAKARKHALNNPRAQFHGDKFTDPADVLAARKVTDLLTLPMCCPSSEGAAAAVLCSEEFVYKYGLQGRAVEISSMAVATDTPRSFESCMDAAGYDMTQRAAALAFEEAGLTPEQVDVVECHSCFASAEMAWYSALGFCRPEDTAALVEAGAFGYGGDDGHPVVNPSGGLLAKGHPLGATGVAQVFELVTQLRGEAGTRQVRRDGGTAAVGLAHNVGLGGACAVMVMQQPKFSKQAVSAPTTDDKRYESLGKPKQSKL